MANGHDKLYKLIDLKKGDGTNRANADVTADLNAAQADGFGEFYGVNETFVFLYQGKAK
jgi:hypothetical protein